MELNQEQSVTMILPHPTPPGTLWAPELAGREGGRERGRERGREGERKEGREGGRKEGITEKHFAVVQIFLSAGNTIRLKAHI